MDEHPPPRIGQLALAYGKLLTLSVHRSNAGYYIGTVTDEGPFTRESVEYWRQPTQAKRALVTGSWSQRLDL